MDWTPPRWCAVFRMKPALPGSSAIPTSLPFMTQANAMEFIQGTTLHELLAEQHILATEDVIQYSRQICKGLDYAHSHGIVHRDVKPANIMITANGTVKIMDFGIAKAGGSMTSTGQVLGTPNYMAPEQVKGRPLDGRS